MCCSRPPWADQMRRQWQDGSAANPRLMGGLAAEKACQENTCLQAGQQVRKRTWKPWNFCFLMSASSFCPIDAHTSVYTTSAPFTACAIPHRMLLHPFLSKPL